MSGTRNTRALNAAARLKRPLLFRQVSDLSDPGFISMITAPRTKAEMYSLYKQGKFGSSLQVWDSEESMLESGYTGLIGLRYSDTSAVGKFFRTKMTLKEARDEYRKWLDRGAKPEFIVWCSYLDMDSIVIQGEVMRDHQGLNLRYSTEKGVPNTPSKWKKPQWAHGLRAKTILQQYMNEKSFDNLQELLDTFTEDDVVIEFSVVSYGLDNGHNTVFWEVRKY